MLSTYKKHVKVVIELLWIHARTTILTNEAHCCFDPVVSLCITNGLYLGYMSGSCHECFSESGKGKFGVYSLLC